jgi:hypothetical protein
MKAMQYKSATQEKFHIEPEAGNKKLSPFSTFTIHHIF